MTASYRRRRRASARFCALGTALLVGAAAGAGEAGSGSAWRLVHQRDGITIMQRPVTGSAHNEFLGVTEVDAPLARVVAALDDIDTRRRFNTSTRESREVARSGLGKLVTYDRVGAPWPVADRDMVVAIDFHVDLPAGHVVIDFREVTRPDVPPVPGVVRVPLVRGHFLMRPIGGGQRTEVKYLVRYDPGGSVPAWVANAFSKKAPLQTLTALRRFAPTHPPGSVEQEIAGRADYRGLMESATP